MSDPVDFGVVQAEENEVIQERRTWLTDKTDPIDGEDEASFSGTLGLALSGGGIRSATFNLGMLQAFAEQRMISNLDYLSTVSGGGYIGSWLTAWIFRDGDVTNTELFLAPDFSLNNRAIRSPAQPTANNERDLTQLRAKNSHACEPDPIKHLRASSNYLALRPGILSIDSWSMVTIYVRNVLLNALVVLPTVLTVVMGVLFFCGLYELIDHRNPPLVLWSAVVLLLMSYALQQLCLVDVLRNANEPTKGEQLAKQYEQRLSWFFYFGWRFLVVAAFLLSLDLTSNLSNFDNLIISCGKRFGVTDYLAQASILATIFGLISGIIQCIFVLGFVPLHKRLNSVIYRLCAGFVSGAMGVALLVIIRVWMTKTDVTWASHLSLPLVLLAIFVCESARTAIICRVENPETREWTSVFQSCCLRIAFTTLVLVFLVRYLGQEVVGKQWIATASFSAVWGTVALACLKLAHGSGFTGLARIRWLDYLILIGPPTFLTGCIVLVAASVEWMFGGNFDLHWVGALVSLAVAVLAGTIVDINIFSLQEMYQSRLVRAFLGASRPRTAEQQLGSPIRSDGPVRIPNSITQLSSEDDIDLCKLRYKKPMGCQQKSSYTGPIHLINLAVNYCQDVALEYQERKADSFVISPLYCGANSLGYRSTAAVEDTRKVWWHFWGPRTIKTPGYGNGLQLGRAMALSGAAVSPSMGYYSSPPVTALLTIFNLRLGAWCGNPKLKEWHRYGPTFGWYHLMKETLSATASTSKYVYLSDGGHFDNLGVYELLRRRVTYIFVSDAGADARGACNELGMVLRKATVDFGIHVEMDTEQLSIDKETGHSNDYVAVGLITYPATVDAAETEGYLIYMKMTMTGNEPVEVATYKKLHGDFPHQSTIHQFYSESQFESYRRLGLEIGRRVLVDSEDQYVDGHPRLPPDKPRNAQQLQTFLEIVVANNRLKETDDWEANSSSFNKRYAELTARLLGDLRLTNLKAQVDLISSIIALSEDNWYTKSARTKEWMDRRREHEKELGSLFEQRRTVEEDCAEQAWMAEAITLLDEVITDLNLTTYDRNRTRGWMRVIRIWMNTHAFEKLWLTIEPHFLVARQKFVKDLLSDEKWISSQTLLRSKKKAEMQATSDVTS